jgi:hypothetical protein
MLHDVLIILIWGAAFVAPMVVLDALDARNKRK